MIMRELVEKQAYIILKLELFVTLILPIKLNLGISKSKAKKSN